MLDFIINEMGVGWVVLIVLGILLLLALLEAINEDDDNGK